MWWYLKQVNCKGVRERLSVASVRRPRRSSVELRRRRLRHSVSRPAGRPPAAPTFAPLCSAPTPTWSLTSHASGLACVEPRACRVVSYRCRLLHVPSRPVSCRAVPCVFIFRERTFLRSLHPPLRHPDPSNLRWAGDEPLAVIVIVIVSRKSPGCDWGDLITVYKFTETELYATFLILELVSV